MDRLIAMMALDGLSLSGPTAGDGRSVRLTVCQGFVLTGRDLIAADSMTHRVSQ